MNVPTASLNKFTCRCPIESPGSCKICPLYLNRCQVNKFIYQNGCTTPIGFTDYDLFPPFRLPLGIKIKSHGLSFIANYRADDLTGQAAKSEAGQAGQAEKPDRGTGRAEDADKGICSEKPKMPKPKSKLFSVWHKGTWVLDVYAYLCVAGPDKYWFLSEKGKIIQKVSLTCEIKEL